VNPGAVDPLEVRARALLRAVPAGVRLAEACLVPIPSGAHNRCWRADTSDGPAFIRLAHREARRFGADWESEWRLLGIASRAGCAPEPWLAVPTEGLLVTEFLAGGPPDADAVAAPAGLERVGRLLQGVHALEPVAAIRRLDFATQAQRLELQRPPHGPVERRLRARAQHVFAQLSAGQRRRAPCHNDVHRANLLDDGRTLRLVDWEYGGVGDPIYDLAGFASHHALGAGQVGLLLEAYGGRIRRARLAAACWAYDYVQWLWHRLAAHLDVPGNPDSARAATELARRLSEPP
jgi:Ser/Thr protein kinase RdoA (MazF antagonist)